MDIVLDKKGIGLKMETSACLRIEQNGLLAQRIPTRQIDSITIACHTNLDTTVMQRLVEHNIPLIILPGRNSRPFVSLEGQTSGSIQTRLKQYACSHDEKVCLTIAREVIAQKLRSMAYGCYFLQALGFIDIVECFTPEYLITQGKRIENATDLGQLRGVEGVVSRDWFEVIRRVMPCRWQFTHRNRRPPKDPVNALLSLSYTMALNEVKRAIARGGLDKELGFLHEIVPGRPSLALDLIEPLRPLVDLFVVCTILNDIFILEDFISQGEGVWLGKPARAKYFAQWFEWKQRPVTPFPSAEGLCLFNGATFDPDESSLTDISWHIVRSFEALIRQQGGEIG